MSFILLKWCEPNSPIRYPIRRQVRDRPTVGKKVYIQSDRLLCALCSSWHCFSVLLFTFFEEKKNIHKKIRFLSFFFLFFFFTFTYFAASRREGNLILTYRLKINEERQRDITIVSKINPFLFSFFFLTILDWSYLCFLLWISVSFYFLFM